MANYEVSPTDAAHTCHAIGCSAVIPPRLFMCREHWYKLPYHYRKEVFRYYKAGQEVSKNPSRKYIQAASAAIAWLNKKTKRESNGQAEG